jgi:hypothetical protein
MKVCGCSILQTPKLQRQDEEGALYTFAQFRHLQNGVGKILLAYHLFFKALNLFKPRNFYSAPLVFRDLILAFCWKLSRLK